MAEHTQPGEEIEPEDTDANLKSSADEKDHSYGDKRAILNEDEVEDINAGGGDNPLGDLTNREDDLNARRELKGQRSRSALIHDEVEDLIAANSEVNIHNTVEEVSASDGVKVLSFYQSKAFLISCYKTFRTRLCWIQAI